jgi:endogenous inhibitor of DNA gyrase (YacG/DUF329 family)
MSKLRCPICDAEMPGNSKEYPDFPFCSKRCRIIDLGRWLGESYKVEGQSPAKPGAANPRNDEED